MDIKDIAKEIRAVLKSTFPATKFSVTISRFSQGSSADISWTDGPTKTQVNDLISKYGTRSQFINTDRAILAATLEVKTTPKVKAAETPAPQPESQPSQPDALEVLTETAPNNQVSELEAELLNIQELLKSTRKLANTLESEVYRLTIQITAVNLTQLANKAEIKQIILTRDEGTIAESGTTVTTNGWLKAERILKQWAATISSPIRVDKCRIVFEFADGESFRLNSFELMQKHRFGVNLAQELLTELQHMAGEIIPAHMTRQDYENYCKFCKINPDVYKQLLNSWAIPA